MIISWTGCSVLFIKHIYVSSFQAKVTWLDTLLFIYLIYLTGQCLFYPVDKEYFLDILCLAGIYFLFRHLPVQLIRALLSLLPVLAIVQIVYGYNRLIDPGQGISNITGIFGNTGIFGGFIAIGLVADLGLLLSEKQRKYPVRQILWSVLFLLLTIQLIYSQSRAAWLAAGTGIIVIIFFKIHKPFRYKIAILAAFLLVSGALLSTQLYRFKKDSADGRLLIWTVSVNLFKEKPVTGFGPDGFRKNYLLRQGEYFKNHPDSPWGDLAGDTSSPFNEFLKIGIEQGIIGLLFVFGILFLICRNMASPPVLRAILAAIMVFSLFSYPFDFLFFQLLAILCLAGIASTLQPVAMTGFIRNLLKKPLLKPLAVLPVIVISVLVLVSACKYYRDIKKWNQVVYAFSSAKNQQITGFQSLYPSLKRNAWFIFIYGKALYDAGNYSKAVSLLEEAMELFPSAQTGLLLGESYEKIGECFKAIETWETAAYIKPSSFAPHYNMARLYFDLQDYERAREKVNEVIEKKIKIDAAKIDRMKQEMHLLKEKCDY